MTSRKNQGEKIKMRKKGLSGLKYVRSGHTHIRMEEQPGEFKHCPGHHCLASR
jgi:hypothetical protein